MWQREESARLKEENPLCRRCNEKKGSDIHHIIPVYRDPSLAFDRNNITLLCGDCHNAVHEKQDWQNSQYLYGSSALVTDVVLRGVEPTYDLSIAGEFPNFLANGVVVHNSRNSASSRAIPVRKMIEAVQTNPYIPGHWGKNQKGMQASDEQLEGDDRLRAMQAWTQASLHAVESAEALLALNVHKQTANRLLEPFLWHTVIVTATEWENFFGQRCHPAAHPDIRIVAEKMREALLASSPTVIDVDEPHLPYLNKEDYLEDLPLLYESLPEHTQDICLKFRSLLRRYTGAAWDDCTALLPMVSVARCARVSYLNHDGKRDLADDVRLFCDLLNGGHMSPFEHVAFRLLQNEYRPSNFDPPWVQLRKMLSYEYNRSRVQGTYVL
jgi:thymidylate synthase ThyX